MMTNEQRDELLISIAKGLNNLQGAFNDFRVEIKTELNTKVNALDQKFTNKIDALDQKFTSKIDALDQKFTNRINALDQKFTNKIDALDQRVDTLEKDNVQIKSDIKTLGKKYESLHKDNIQIKSDISALAKSQSEFRNETEANFKALPEIIRDIYKTNYETAEHLKKHDIEIQELQSKLA